MLYTLYLLYYIPYAMPSQVFLNDTFLGGWDRLYTLQEQGLLRNMLEVCMSQPDPTDHRLRVEASAPSAAQQAEEAVASEQPTFCVAGRRHSYDDLLSILAEVPVVRRPKNIFRVGGHTNCFSGMSLVDFIKGRLQIATRADAVTACAQMYFSGLFCHVSDPAMQFVDGEHYYCFHFDRSTYCLNNEYKFTDGTLKHDPNTELRLLRAQFYKVYNAHIDNGGKVNYAALGASKEFHAFHCNTCRLQAADLTTMSPAARTAFVINAYNLLVLHGFTVIGPPMTAWQRNTFFTLVSYNIGGLVFTLDELEHGILRGNKPNGLRLKTPFASSDPRCRLVIQYITM